MKKMLINIFYGLVVESLVGILSLSVDDQNTTVFILVAGTILIGLISIIVSEQSSSIITFLAGVVFAGWIFIGAPFPKKLEVGSEIKEIIEPFFKPNLSSSDEEQELVFRNAD